MRLVGLDANALEAPTEARAAALAKLLALEEREQLILHLPKGVLSELEHPIVPPPVRRRALTHLFTCETRLTPQEVELRQQIRTYFRGNAKPGKHQADADHLFEAVKYGWTFFLTYDLRIISKTDLFSEAAFKQLWALNVEDFVDLCRAHGLVE